MKHAKQFLLTLFTILCCTTISGASIQESHAGVVFEKACVLEGETGFWGDFNAPRTGATIADDVFVRFDPVRLDAAIDSGGIQQRFFDQGKVWLTKYGDIKNVHNAVDLEQVLYRQNLWPEVSGKFSQGATLRVVNGVDDAVPAGMTNMINGVRQWRVTRDVLPTDLETILHLPP